MYYPAFLLLAIVVLLDAASDVENNTVESSDILSPSVLIVLLVRNKAHVLPHTLALLDRLDYPKHRISLLIRSDHNEDASLDVLSTWLTAVQEDYHSVNASFDALPEFYPNDVGPLAWVPERFVHVMKLKEAGLEHARHMWADYVWFLDADAFTVHPQTLHQLMSHGLAVAAPMLTSSGLYANFWAGMSDEYYYERTEDYLPILERKRRGCHAVPMIHSSVLVDLRRAQSTRLTFLPKKLGEDYDGPQDDIIVFALSARSLGTKLHICNDIVYGYIPQPLEQEQELEDDGVNLVNVHLQAIADSETFPVREDLRSFLLPLPSEKDNVGVDKVYMINLNRRPDRKAKMDACFDQLGIAYDLVEAVDGRNMTQEYLQAKHIRMMEDFVEPYHGRPSLTYGEIGCFMSHYHVWQDVIEKGHERVIVFEDDIRFEPHFRYRLNRVFNEVKALSLDWDLIFLGRKILHNVEEPWVDDSDMLVHVGYTYWTLAYVLSERGARKLVDEQPLAKMVPVDEYLPIMYDRHPKEEWKSHYKHRDLKAFSVHPLLVHPTHYTGEEGYISDTENTLLLLKEEEEKDEL